jgi:hypothetical protein
MKHLTSYNEARKYSVRSGKVITDIRDIGLDIQDEGFRVGIILDSWNGEYGYEDWVVKVDKMGSSGRQYFDISEIRDFLNRMVVYSRTGTCDIVIYIESDHNPNAIILYPNASTNKPSRTNLVNIKVMVR